MYCFGIEKNLPCTQKPRNSFLLKSKNLKHIYIASVKFVENKN